MQFNMQYVLSVGISHRLISALAHNLVVSNKTKQPPPTQPQRQTSCESAQSLTPAYLQHRATIYCALHEENHIIPKYGGQMSYFRRFIDDIFAIRDTSGPLTWQNFQQDLTFGILKWIVAPPPPLFPLPISIFQTSQFLLTKKVTQKPKRSKRNLIYTNISRRPAVTHQVRKGDDIWLLCPLLTPKLKSLLFHKTNQTPRQEASETWLRKRIYT